MKHIWNNLLVAATGGLLAGMLLGSLEIASLTLLGNGGRDLAALFWAMTAYGLLGFLAGAGLGLVAGILFGRRLPRHLNWWMLVSGAAVFGGAGAIVMRYRLLRDLFQQRVTLFSLPSFALHVGLLVVFGGFFGLALWIARRWARPASVAPSSTEGSLSRRTFLKIALTGGLAALSASAAASQFAGRKPTGLTTVHRTGIPASLRRKPNILLIVADTLRADHLGAYGYAKAKTPNLDAFAADSLRFARMFSQGSWTKPSMATLFTSLYPSSHRAIYKNSVLPSGVTTLAGLLSEQGYLTGGFANNVHLAPLFNFQQGFTDYEFLAPSYLFGATEAGSQTAVYQTARKVNETLFKRKAVHNFYQPAEVVNERAIHWLKARQEDRFFLFLHYMEAHDPYFEHPYNHYAIARVNMPNPSPAMAAEMIRLYDGEIAYLDQRLGELFDWLKQQGLYDETLIVFTADHGEEFYEHGGWWHGLTLYEEQLHVPLFLKLPQQARAGEVDMHLARMLDIAPTILRAAGFDVPKAMQGLDLLEPSARAQLVFAETDHEGNVVQCLRGPDWKLIKANPGNPRGLPPLSLYHVAEDPGETRDMSAAESAKLAELSTRLDEVLALARAQAVVSAQTNLDDATLQQLRNLGY